MPRVGNIVGGKYRLLGPLGEGSMGVVWKALHESLARPFAVKFLKEQAPVDDGVGLKERFFSEARLSAGVRHPNVVAVLDTGITDEGTPYMVMEYLEGESLAQRLDRAPALPVTELLRLMITTLAGLEAVHRAGILHRDLKPENIVLCPEHDEVVPKLVDFGISRLLDVSEDCRIRRLTFPGTTLGTPWYMAPEQAQALHVDQRVDIYAFGVVLYEALSGRLPFEHENIQMLMLLVAAGGAAPLALQRPDLPLALCEVVDHCLATDPSMRFASASALAEALGQVLPHMPAQALCQRRGQPLRLSQLGTPTTAGPPPSRNPTLPAALARLGFARMPPRPVLLGAGAVVVTGLFALLAVAHLPEASATGPPALATPAPPPAATRASPRQPRPAATLTSTSGTTVQAAPELPTTDQTPKPRRPRRRPPEVFRDPGF